MDYQQLTDDHKRELAGRRLGQLEQEHYAAELQLRQAEALEGALEGAAAVEAGKQVAQLRSTIAQIEIAHHQVVAELEGLPAAPTGNREQRRQGKRRKPPQRDSDSVVVAPSEDELSG